MRIIIGIIALTLLSSCTKQVLNESPLGYSFMPAYPNIDSIQPLVIKDTNKVVDSTMKDYVSIPIDSGAWFNKNRQTLPYGVLFSERKSALYVFYKSAWEEQQKD